MIWLLVGLGLFLLMLGTLSFWHWHALMQRGPVSRSLAPFSYNLGVFFIEISLALWIAISSRFITMS